MWKCLEFRTLNQCRKVPQTNAAIALMGRSVPAQTLIAARFGRIKLWSADISSLLYLNHLALEKRRSLGAEGTW